MEKIFYDSYEKRIRITVWANNASNGNLTLHKYVRGVYIDDIFGMDEHETVLTVPKSAIASLYTVTNTENVRDLLTFTAKNIKGRDAYECLKSRIDSLKIAYSEEELY